MRNFKSDLEKVIEATGLDNIIKFPFNETETLRNISIDALDLSVRSSNGLRRKGVNTVGGIIDNWELFSTWRGLGVTSVKEIKNSFYQFYYSTLSKNEIDNFWKRFVEMNYLQ